MLIHRYSDSLSREPYSIGAGHIVVNTGLSPSEVPRSRELFLNDLGLFSTTSLPSFQTEIQFALFPFRSLLLGESFLFSFPAGTKMFQFPAYAFLSELTCVNVVALGDLGFKGRMRLTQAYRSLPRPSSQSKPSYSSRSLVIRKKYYFFHPFDPQEILFLDGHQGLASLRSYESQVSNC